MLLSGTIVLGLTVALGSLGGFMHVRQKFWSSPSPIMQTEQLDANIRDICLAYELYLRYQTGITTIPTFYTILGIPYTTPKGIVDKSGPTRDQIINAMLDSVGADYDSTADSDRNQRVDVLINMGNLLSSGSSLATYNAQIMPLFDQGVADEELPRMCAWDWNDDLEDE